ncbi:MAG: hypothetical protein R3B49_07895 [Phycisphaerales bacterium]
MPETTASANTPSPPPGERVLGALRAVRRTARALLVSRALLLVVAVALGAVILGGLVDYALRLPAPARLIALALALAGLVALVVRWVIPAARFRPSLTTIALHAQSLDDQPARRLAAGVDLVEAPPEGEPMREALRTLAVDRALDGFDPRAARRVLAWRDTGRALALALALVAFALTITFQWPSLASIGARRLLTPWSGAEWPRRFPVLDVTGLDAHPLDAAFPIRAAVLRPLEDSHGSVEAHFRVVSGDGLLADVGPTRRVVLTDQDRRYDLGPDATPEHPFGVLFERLIEPGAFERPGRTAKSLAIEYWLQTPDDRTPTRRVLLVDPPALLDARATVTPPAYALDATDDAGFIAGETDLGTGTDERAVLGPVLAGSRVELDLTFNKPLPIPARPAWLAGLEAGASAPVAFTVDSEHIHIATTLARHARLSVDVADEHAITPRDPIAFTLEAIDDAPPEAVIADPAHDEGVLATAVIDLSAEGRDDVGLARVAIERQLARPPADSAGAPPEPMGDPATLADVTPAEGPSRRLIVTHRLDLAPLALSPGDEVRLTALATDTFALDGLAHDATRSPVRTLHIIAESELIEQIRGELAGLRRTVMRLDEEQGELERLAAERPVPEEVSPRQSALSQRLEIQRGLVDRLAERQERNALDDPGLRGVLDDARALLDAAQRASDDAAAALAQTDAPESQRQQAQDEQAKVRDDLGQLAELLDRGEDGWLVRRSFERLLDEQKRLRDETARLTESTVGKSRDQLDQRELTALERIAQRQREAAEQARGAIDEMGERGRDLSQTDPAQSAAMSSAAARARDQRLAEQLEQAGDQVAQNQTASAQQTQDDIIKSLEDVLEELDQADRAKDSALRRQLASLVDSIKALVARQEREVQTLESGRLGGLDEGMIRLNQNTLAVRADAAREPSTVAVADLLERAATAQQSAIVALRAAPPDAAEADRQERASLLLLRRAQAEAERLLEQAEQREADRLRRELRQAYRDALEEQAALAGETTPLVGQRLSRRDRATARSLGGRQDELRQRVADILSQIDGLTDVRVFALAHRRLDALMHTAADALTQGDPTDRTARDQAGAARLLASLADALKNPDTPESPFEQANAGGGGQGGGGQGGQQQDQGPVPPIAELMLLRSMQQQAAELTRLLGDAGSDADAGEISGVADLQRSLADETAELIRKMNENQGEAVPLDEAPAEDTP